jgi:hypothetical protein
MSFHKCIALLLAYSVLTGCNQLQTRIDSAEALATDHGLTKITLQTETFGLVSYQSVAKAGAVATFYIEGDGLAWLSRKRVSQNPTPKNPVALRLALADPSTNVIYLARPCQYVDLKIERNCRSDYWTTKRFAPEVVASMDEAITQIKRRTNIDKIRLVGYSGGGTIAAILAATRDDVIDLRTVAGNLDVDMFARYHKVTQLFGSMNPVDFADTLTSMPQIHFVGEKDDIITRPITESYINSLKKYDVDLRCVRVEQVKSASHANGWESAWKSYANEVAKCKN